VIDFTPQPLAFQIGSLAIHWYGIAYALGLAGAYFVIEREARRRGEDTRYLVNGMIVVAVAALIGRPWDDAEAHAKASGALIGAYPVG
jgi:prolipoprotein diacylglyceryltransferase